MHTQVNYYVNHCGDRVVASQVYVVNLHDVAQLTVELKDYIFRASVERSLDGRHQSEQPSPLPLHDEALDEHLISPDALNALDGKDALRVLCDQR